jgi:hypothetical protein
VPHSDFDSAPLLQASPALAAVVAKLLAKPGDSLAVDAVIMEFA